MTVPRRTAAAAAATWLALAAALVILDVPLLRPVGVGGYLLTVPGFVAVSALAPADADVDDDADTSDRIDATTCAVLSVVLSLAWLAAATVALTLLGVPLVALLALSGLWIALAYPLMRPLRVAVAVAVGGDRRERAALAAVVATAVSYVGAPHLLSARVTLSSHGALHSAITYGVLRGNVPPTHPGLAYEPYVAYYWPYHVLLAGLVETMGVTPVEASLAIDLVAIAGILALIASLARREVGLSRTEGILAALVPIWGLATIEPPLRYLLGYEPTGFVGWSGRIDPFLGKFVRVSGFPLGLFLFVVALAFLFRGTYGDDPSRRTWVGFVVAAVLLFHVHATTALFAFLGLGAATAASTATTLRADGPSAVRWRPLAAWTAVGLGCLPFVALLQSAGAADESIRLLVDGRVTIPVPALGTVTLDGPHAQYVANARNVVFPLAVTGPFAAVGYLRLRGRRPAEARALAVVVGALAVLAAVLTLEDGNQYKAAYLLVVPAAPLVAVGLRHVYARSGSLRPLLVVGFVVLLLFTPLSVLWVEHVDSPWATNDDYAFDGTDVRFSESAPVDAAAFEWIDEETPEESAILVSEGVYDDLAYQPGGAQTVMVAAAVAERDLYYATYELPEHLRPPDAERAAAVERAFSCDGVDDAAFDDLEGPLYVVVDADERRACDLYGSYADSPRWTLVTEGSGVGVFAYDPPGRGDRDGG